MDAEAELNEQFSSSFPDGIPKDIMTELLSMLRVHSITAEELFYKWESYSMKMGEGVTLTMETVRGFKQDVQEALERETRTNAGRHTEKRGANTATPRAAAAAAAGGDMFGMLDQLTPNASNVRSAGGFGSAKRKAEFSSPATPRVKTEKLSSQLGTRTPGTPGDGMPYVFLKIHVYTLLILRQIGILR
jgi:DNA polymerase alpha subunit B